MKFFTILPGLPTLSHQPHFYDANKQTGAHELAQSVNNARVSQRRGGKCVQRSADASASVGFSLWRLGDCGHQMGGKVYRLLVGRGANRKQLGLTDRRQAQVKLSHSPRRTAIRAKPDD